jgi:hypothetical protein
MYHRNMADFRYTHLIVHTLNKGDNKKKYNVVQYHHSVRTLRVNSPINNEFNARNETYK